MHITYIHTYNPKIAKLKHKKIINNIYWKIEKNWSTKKNIEIDIFVCVYIIGRLIDFYFFFYYLIFFYFVSKIKEITILTFYFQWYHSNVTPKMHDFSYLGYYGSLCACHLAFDHAKNSIPYTRKRLIASVWPS